GTSAIYLARSNDHAATFAAPAKVTPSLKSVQFPEVVTTGAGHLYITFRSFTSVGHSTDGVYVVGSTNCGRTFSTPKLIATFTPYDAQDQRAPEAVTTPTSPFDDQPMEADSGSATDVSRDCGDFNDHCSSGYTFFRRETEV